MMKKNPNKLWNIGCWYQPAVRNNQNLALILVPLNECQQYHLEFLLEIDEKLTLLLGLFTISDVSYPNSMKCDVLIEFLRKSMLKPKL